MPSRYALEDIAKLTDRFHLKNGVPRGVNPRQAITPTDKAPVIVSRAGENELRLMNWGLLPANSTNTNSVFRYKTYNTKSERIFNKHSTAKAVRTQRCIVPANGFYEAQKTEAGTQWMYVTPRSRELWALAGIYSSWEDANTQTHHAFSIITTESTTELSAFDPRMPIILRPEEESTWLDPAIDDLSSIYRAMRPADNHSFVITATR